MKLSTRSRYGARLLLDIAQHHRQGPVQIGDIARRQNISVKYLEQIIIPLKKARIVNSVRGTNGGHYLAKPPEQISIGEIVAILEGGKTIMECTDRPETCERSAGCLTRSVWKEAQEAMYAKLNSISLADLIERGATSKVGIDLDETEGQPS